MHLLATLIALGLTTTPFAIEVVDAKTDRPIVGARVAAIRAPVSSDRYPPCPEGLLAPQVPAAPGYGEPPVMLAKVTDAAGHAEFSADDALKLSPQPPGCPPGAPCMAPPQYAVSVRITAPGYLGLHLEPSSERGRWDAPRGTVRLVASQAKVTTGAQAIAAMSAVSEWKTWLNGRAYQPAQACLRRDGTWRVWVDSVSWPKYLPYIEGRLSALDGKPSLTSCPTQGMPMKVARVEAGEIELVDRMAGRTFRCVESAGPPCGALLARDEVVVSASGNPPEPRCDHPQSGTFPLGLGRADPPIQNTCNIECRRVR